MKGEDDAPIDFQSAAEDFLFCKNLIPLFFLRYDAMKSPRRNDAGWIYEDGKKWSIYCKGDCSSHTKFYHANNQGEHE